MNDSKNPLSPHLQIYRWQVSSLVSITHRITGILNLLGLIFICAWISSAGIGENFFESFSVFLKSFIGKFILIGFTWSMSYHLLSGIRHFFWDLGYGYEIKTANPSRKWIFQRISAIIVAPLIIWFLISLISLSTGDYNSVINFFSKPLFLFLTIILLITGFFHAKIGLSEIYEDYIQDEKIKNVANLLTFLLSIIIPLVTIILLLLKF